MSAKKVFQFILLVVIVLTTFSTAGTALAWSGCGSTYVVQRGDSLGMIANRCGTTVAAIRQSNPNLGYWIYAGQTLWLPDGVNYSDGNSYGNGYSTYYVQRGDTLKSIASRFGTTWDVLASLNGIYNENLIYAGQRLIVPNGYSAPAPSPYYPPPSPYYPQTGYVSSSGTYVVQWGDTLRKIADRMNVSLSDLIAVNPQLWNPNLIYFGQVINLPGSASLYTIQRGDTLRIIAARYGTNVQNILALNPQIWNPNWIYAGQVIRVW
jgi:LysM repeat protein